MSHAYHDALPGFNAENVLTDGCPECEERAARGLGGLTELDDQNFSRLWGDMLTLKMSGDGPARVASNCDHAMMNAMYTIAVLLQRNAGLDPVEVLARIDSHRMALRSRLGLS